MKISVLSGKGGTGKTFVAVNLAAVAEHSVYIDCDVEEPNGHLFFRPRNVETVGVEVLVPEVDQDKCDGCRLCVNFCKFKALAYVADQLLVFEQMCHSCGGCVLFCPQKALKEKPRTIGRIEKGYSQDVLVTTGFLNPGEESGVPIIEKLLKETPAERTTIVDSPPGSSCSVMESIIDADYCILVAEPTTFGIHNFKIVHELVELFEKPLGVIVNKSFGNDELIEDYCKEKDLAIIGNIPFDQKLGQMLSRGDLVVREDVSYQKIFAGYLQSIAREVTAHETTARS